MTNEGSYVALGLKVWKAQLDRADKLFRGLSSEVVLREIAPGRNRLLYLWGHLTAMHDAMLPLLGLGDRFHPEFDVAFVSNPDKSQAAIPSHEQVRQAWKTVNGELWKGFEKMSWSDWLQRHTAVSEEDFAKDASRHRFVWLANCCFAHISLGFPFLLRFCDEQSGHSVYPFHCYPGPLARSWRCPFHSCRVPYPQAPTLDRESIPATIAEFVHLGPHPRRLDGALGASHSPAPCRNRSEAFDTASPS